MTPIKMKMDPLRIKMQDLQGRAHPWISSFTHGLKEKKRKWRETYMKEV